MDLLGDLRRMNKRQASPSITERINKLVELNRANFQIPGSLDSYQVEISKENKIVSISRVNMKLQHHWLQLPIKVSFTNQEVMAVISPLYYQVLNFAMIVSSALMIWKGLIVVTGSESPIVVVLSGSMEPAFHRGDLLFLTNFQEDPIRAGEIVVFKVEGRDIPIVHRVIKVHEKDNGDIKFLTKGDNNEVDDRGLYREGQNWLEKKDVVGRARGFLPFVGMVTIVMNDYPKFKYAVLAIMGAFVLLKRES